METVIRLNESVRQELRHSQMRTLITLFLSSFIVYYWYTALFEVFARGYFPLSRSLTLLPPILNGVSWLLWAALHYLSVMKGAIQQKSAPMDIGQLLDAHQFTLLQHNRQRRTEALISLIAAFQMFCMALAAAYVQFVLR